MNIFTVIFWKAAGERAVKTFAQSSVAVITANATGLLDVDYVGVGSIAGLAALVSVLTSIGSDALTRTGPSLANEVAQGKHERPATYDPRAH